MPELGYTKTVIWLPKVVRTVYDRAFVNRIVVAVLNTEERVYGVLTGYDQSFLYLSNCCILRDNYLVETDFAVVGRKNVVALATVEKSVVYGVDVREMVARSAENGVRAVDWKNMASRRVFVQGDKSSFDGTFVTVFGREMVLRDVVSRAGLDEFGILSISLDSVVYVSAYSERKVYLKAKTKKRREEVQPISVVSLG